MDTNTKTKTYTVVVSARFAFDSVETMDAALLTLSNEVAAGPRADRLPAVVIHSDIANVRIGYCRVILIPADGGEAITYNRSSLLGMAAFETGHNSSEAVFFTLHGDGFVRVNYDAANDIVSTASADGGDGPAAE